MLRKPPIEFSLLDFCVVTPETPPKSPGVLRCVTRVSCWPFLEYQGGLAFEVVVPFFKDF
jgi:hypothetical protein